MKITSVPKGNKTTVILGSGGTGSWLASFLSKLPNPEEKLIIDGDLVEPKNVLRQNFTQEDVSFNKAEAIAKRTNLSAYGEFLVDSSLLKEHFKEVGGVPLVVGCLDNNASRKIVHDLFNDTDFPNFIWVDSGNSERSGQIYIALKENNQVKYPSPLDIDDVLNNFEGDERRPDQISCAEHSESAPQNVTANVTAATLLFDVLNIIYQDGSLLANKISWDTRTMSVQKETILEKVD